MKKKTNLMIIAGLLIFVTGCNASSKNVIKACGLKMVEIPGKNYSMLSTEVTQKLYKEIMGENPSWFQGGTESGYYKAKKEVFTPAKGEKIENLPVVSVSLYDVAVFCNLLSNKYGYTPVYALDGKTDITEWPYVPHKGDMPKAKLTANTEADGFRVPTDEEWIFAAKGGKEKSDSGVNNSYNKIEWLSGNSNKIPHEVGKLTPNAYGLYDMNGNVSEWCLGFTTKQLYYTKGGSYASDILSEYYLIGETIYKGYSNLGFRIVRTTSKENASVEPITKMVKIPGKNYSMLSTEVTTHMYESIMGKNPGLYEGEDWPIRNISLRDMMEFCNKLSEKEGKTPVYSISPQKLEMDSNADGYRLPTDEEWEYAAKGGEDFKYSGSDFEAEVAWFARNYDGTFPVAKRKANGYGLYDMSGNVWEVCWNGSGDMSSKRGGSWYNDSHHLSTPVEEKEEFIGEAKDVGFRIVCSTSK